jgi:hypothetical protein
MNPRHLYTNIVYSLVKKLIEEMPPELAAVYVDWDAHAEIHELPSDDVLVGLSGVSLDHEYEEIRVVFGVGLATQNDPNLFKLRALTSHMYGAFFPETRVELYDKADIDAGGNITPTDWMILTTPIEILPINRAEIRNVQFINCSALLNPAALSFGG